MKNSIILAAGMAATAVFLTACNEHSNAASGPAGAPPAPIVTVATVTQKDVVEWDEFTGRSAAVQSVEIRPQISGYIKDVRFQSGQLVKKGDILFVIDARFHQADFERTQADVDHAHALLENAKLEADRTPNLLTNHAISTEEAETRLAQFDAAKAALAGANAARDYAKLNLEYTEVRSPIDGRVSRALITEGNYVSGGSGAGTVLTTVVSVDPIYVYADVDEDSFLKFNALAAAGKAQPDKDGHTPVRMELADETEFPHQGYIESFDNHLDQGTGTILVRTLFANPDGRIVPGLFARIRLPMSDKHTAIMVDDRAIATDQARKYVLTLTSSNTVAYTAVDLGPEVNGERIIRTGLKQGDKIVVNGMQRVRPGMTVTPEEKSGTTPVAAR
jgi:RND family efflux transporter MFP subunit